MPAAAAKRVIPAGPEIRKLPVGEISRIADLHRTAICSVDGIREIREPPVSATTCRSQGTRRLAASCALRT